MMMLMTHRQLIFHLIILATCVATTNLYPGGPGGEKLFIIHGVDIVCDVMNISLAIMVHS